MTIKIVNITMDGAEHSYTVDADCKSAAFQAIGADATMQMATGASPTWTLKDGRPESIDTRNVEGQTFIFKAAAGTLQIRMLLGGLS